MKKTIILLLMVMSVSIVQGQDKQKVAIYTTDDSGENIVEFVGEFLTDAIVKRGTYIAVERTTQFLKELNKEQSYQRSGQVDDDQISRLGKQMGVQLVCVVKIGKSGEQLFISARLIDVETATLKSTARPVRFDSDNWAEIEKSCETITASLFGGGVTSGASSHNKGISGSQPGEAEMVFVQGGMFVMGCTSEQGSDCFDDERPPHTVTVSDFYIGKYEVTQKQWTEIMGSNPSYFKGDNRPVENVSWNEVQVFISRLNAQTGGNYRLPTEAEWEYAARGGNKSKGYKYSGGNMILDIAWYSDNSGNTTHVVGTKHPNELGIYDMSGNVWEWCHDWYGSYSSYSQTDPTGASSGSYRVFRGGSWFSNARGVRVSARSISPPVNRGSFIGFRLARSSR